MTATAKRPRTSILLPVHNVFDTLPACLRSIQRQTDPDWECIIVDDGSTDGSLRSVHRLASADPRFRVIAQPHRGLVPALVGGLEHCSGRFVARMDADDVMHRARLALQAETLEREPSLAAVGCWVRLFPRRGLGNGMRAYEHWLNGIDSPRRTREESFVECPIAHPTLMIRGEVLKCHAYRDCGWPEDYDLVLRLLASGCELGVVPQRLLAWRNHPKKLSLTSDTYGIDRFTACKAEHIAASFLVDSDEYVLWGYGGTGRALQRALRDRGKRPAAILELHPGRIGNTIAGARVIRPEQWLASPCHRLVVSVAGARARREIRAALCHAGLREAVDYVCAA